MRIDDLKGGIIYDEVKVEFPNRTIRDFVASRGPKLADYTDRNRKPTCGIRMEVPESLMPTFKLLKRYEFHLRKSEETPVKCHIKFDDYKRSIFMQVRFKSEGEEWMSVSPEEAYEAMKKVETKRNVRLRSLNSPPNNRANKQSRGLSESKLGSGRPGGADENVMEIVEVEDAPVWKPAPRKTK